jgi:hypothetical protein
MTTAFKRQLGAESGVQLNPLRDNSEIPTQGNEDQLFAIMMRATRGRIDKPFVVDRGNVLRKSGPGERISVSALNEAHVHVVEALNNGAYQAVVQRIVTSSAVIKYAVAYIGSGAVLTPTIVAGAITDVVVTNGGTGYAVGQTIVIDGDGTGATATVATVTAGVIATVTVSAGGTSYTSATATIENSISFAAETAIPATPYLFAVKHLECFNDGIKVDFRAEEKRSGGVSVANDKITVLVKDKDDNTLYEFYGSLDPAALDDYGNSAFLTNTVSAQTDAVEITVGAITSIETTSPAYGSNATTGAVNWAKSATLTCFTEGGTSYATADYIAARTKLETTPYNFAYISSGGSKAVGLLSQLVQLAYNTNRQLRFDIDGSLTPDAAITFVESLNLAGNANAAHLIHAFWSPLKAIDPTGINGKTYIGTATLNIAYACGRNAQVNAKGFAPKNYTIAGREWPIARSGITQTYQPEPGKRDQDLNALARAKINPVLFETYTGGGRYVFLDSLTSAQVESSLKKLISVADMSTSIDDAVTRYGKDVLQLPMDVAIKRMNDYLRRLFTDAQASGWLVPSSDPGMNGAAFKYEVKADEVYRYDRLQVSYWLRYDGCVRQIFVTQTLTR